MKHEAIGRIVDRLRCPHCGAPLALGNQNASLVCATTGGGKRHCFDLARSGYVNLDVGHAGGGDSKELVTARTAFLESGAYEPIVDELYGLLQHYCGGNFILDAGCGEGYYTNRLAYRRETGADFFGVDLSKSAIDAAARSSVRYAEGGDSRAAFAVAGIFDLPVRGGVAGAVLNLFAPCAEQEFRRVLAEDGVLILVGAGEDHLLGLKRAVYETPYRNTPRADLPTEMRHLDSRRLTYTARLTSNAQIKALFSMTPYAFRTSREDAAKLDRLESLETEVDVTLEVYGKSDRAPAHTVQSLIKLLQISRKKR